MSNALKNALAGAGATVAAIKPVLEPLPTSVDATQARQPSRRNTAAITVHYPENVRRQLKVLASEEGRNVEDMVAEALNLLFAQYRKPEIAPRKAMK